MVGPVSIGELLQFDLPRPNARTIGLAAVGSDHQAAALWVALASHRVTPAANGVGQVNRKSLEGGHHVGRNAQFEHINTQVEAFPAVGDPVISVDTKKKELVGPYKNAAVAEAIEPLGNPARGEPMAG
jgi:hypothetical protein